MNALPRAALSGDSTSDPADRATVHIDLGERSYDILIGDGVLDDEATYARLPAGHRAVIVTNTTVGPLYAAKLRAALSGRYAEVQVHELPDGEQFKNWDSLNSIFEELLAHRSDRKTMLFALGGGVVGDLTGFAAACYMRGVPFVQVATTLLAQVDSSVGGKTAVNHPRGKNMIGAFYQPELVVCDLSVLKTLPPREVAAGLAEIIKYGPIADAAFLDWMEAHVEELVALTPQALLHAVKRSCEIKAWVVGQDERESGLRAILNFGHTFGHAIEAGMGYGQWLHGEAVGAGMVMGAELSVRLGLIDRAYADRLTSLIRRAGLPVQGPGRRELPVDRYLELMRGDKKSEAGEMRFVVIEEPGRAAVRKAPDELVRESIEAHTA